MAKKSKVIVKTVAPVQQQLPSSEDGCVPELEAILTNYVGQSLKHCPNCGAEVLINEPGRPHGKAKAEVTL